MRKNRQPTPDSIHDEVQLQFPLSVLRVKAAATDISHGGIGLHCGQRIPVGDEVILIIGFLNSDHLIRFETIRGFVKWCRTQNPGYSAGIEFEKLNNEQHPRLLDFLEKTDPLRKALHHH